jgi:hypothetical protein
LAIIKPVHFPRNQPAPLNHSLGVCWRIAIQTELDGTNAVSQPSSAVVQSQNRGV